MLVKSCSLSRHFQDIPMVLFLLWTSISCFLPIGQRSTRKRHNVLDSRLPILTFWHLFHLSVLSWALSLGLRLANLY